ncbi:MAG: prepilin-type N-terminal cleavage/methylation domain-containing protein [Planctomycetes bacterium]|nr:prepilin-type N-terminal cleavage/methylation domain-containing protein [Planctomycetota bacterium]
MGTPCQNRPRRRPGFTLIELLVVIAIITSLLGLLVLIGPGIIKSEKAARGAQTVQGILFVAKQQALRDRNPYGIRLLRESNNPTNADGSTNPDYYRVRSFQYIQQPADFTGGTVSVTPPSTTITVTGVDLSGGLGTSDPSLWPVQPGDFIQINTDPFYKITGVNVSTPTSATITIDRPYAGGGSTGTIQYRIARSPRPVPGEDTVLLPDDVIVDLSLFDPTQPYNAQTNPYHSWLTPDPVTGNLDILFAPSGVILTGGLNGKIILWVRDEDLSNRSVPSAPGEQTLIYIVTRTGQIAAYAVDTSGGNPYSFTLDPRGGGL